MTSREELERVLAWSPVAVVGDVGCEFDGGGHDAGLVTAFAPAASAGLSGAAVEAIMPACVVESEFELSV